MILDIKGKKLIFGLTWRPINTNGPPMREAVRIGRELNSSLIWHQDRTQFVGVAVGPDVAVKLKEPLYSGAIALAKGPVKGQSALFVYHLPATNADDAQFVVCGIVKGKPKAGFDRVVSGHAALAEVVVDFARVCPGTFMLAGNVDGLRSMLGDERQIDVLPMDLTVLAGGADETAQLRKAKAWSINATVVYRVICLIAIVIAGCMAFARYFPTVSLPFFSKPKAQEKSDQQKYDEAMRDGLNVAVMPVSDLTEWSDWYGAQPFVVGGWVQRTVKCTVASMPIRCVFTYGKQPLSAATNETFEAAKPSNWRPTYSVDGQTVTVTVRAPLKPRVLGVVATDAPTVNDVALHLGSWFQKLQPISKHTLIAPAQPYLTPANVDVSKLANVLYASTWLAQGPLRNVDLLAGLSSHATVTSISLTADLKTPPAADQSKLMLDVSGLVFARK